jgi:hypothetical protein
MTTIESKKNKERKSKGQELFEEHRVRDCTNQNLAVCHMLCCLCKKPTFKQAQDVLSYTKSKKIYNIFKKIK